jgi:hypothetical protein
MSDTPKCLFCDSTSQDIPLIKMLYQGKEHYICPQHMPVIIHKPHQLQDILPGVKSVEGVEPH